MLGSPGGPIRYRSTFNGFSATSGNLGAAIAQAAIAPLRVRRAVKGATGRAAPPWYVLPISANVVVVFTPFTP
jgi:hypothetical protein